MTVYTRGPRLFWIVLVLLLVSIPWTWSQSSRRYHYGHRPTKWNAANHFSREIHLKQGQLVGEILQIDTPTKIERYLGVPYASPPVGSGRFMPPGSPQPWSGVRKADRFSPVCPQRLPPRDNVLPGRRRYLERLIQNLDTQDEDCLYLNIYAPAQGDRIRAMFPVLVFIHGDSYEWGSGNPYDGSMLASYGGVVVVTLNYRLGILGFFRPGLRDGTVSNFGLLDQIAALQWVKENIAEFGGDSSSVTLMGHGTGAVCANLLLVSPVSQGATGLFHRAILMGGTALADWALSSKPVEVTFKVSENINCPLTVSEEEFCDCLRRKRLGDLMNLTITEGASTKKFIFGPMVDGSVIPNEPVMLMSVYKELFSRYELLYGGTESASVEFLDPIELQHGIIEADHNKVLKELMAHKFERRADLAFAKTLAEYRHHGRVLTLNEGIARRDQLLEIVTDARLVSPLVKMAELHSKVNPKSYLYWFTHKTQFGDYSEFDYPRTLPGEELPYVFGVPLVDSKSRYFTQEEKAFSEYIMTLWSNFAKTGNPNAPKRTVYGFTPKDWLDWLEWPEFEDSNQTYLNLGIQPKLGSRYRQKWTHFWNSGLPGIIKSVTTGTSTARNVSKRPPAVGKPDRPIIIGKPIYQPGPPRATSPFNSGLPLSWFENFNTSNRPKNIFGNTVLDPIDQGMGDPPSTGTRLPVFPIPPTNMPTDPSISTQGASMAFIIVIVIGTAFLLINIIAVTYIYVQRVRLKRREQILQNNYEPTRVMGGGGDEDYEAVRMTQMEPTSRWIQRQGSVSTMDPNMKVKDWIAHEISKYSPKYFRRGGSKGDTPSVFSKSLERIDSQLYSSTNRPKKSVLKRSNTTGDGLANPEETAASNGSRVSRTSIMLKPFHLPHTDNHQQAPLPIHHQHSKSDPASYPARVVDIRLEDVNVTSRDEGDEKKSSKVPIEERNFPKVLPDLDEHYLQQQQKQRRISLPPDTSVGLSLLNNNNKDNSPTSVASTLFFGPLVPTGAAGNRGMPPPPPPRVSSTLGRKTKQESLPSSGPSLDIPESIPSSTSSMTGKPSTTKSVDTSFVATQHQQQQSRPQPKIVIKPGTKKSPAPLNTPHVHIGPTKIMLGSIKKQKSLDQSSTTSSILSGSEKSSKEKPEMKPQSNPQTKSPSSSTSSKAKPVECPKIKVNAANQTSPDREFTGSTKSSEEDRFSSSSKTGTVKKNKNYNKK